MNLLLVLGIIVAGAVLGGWVARWLRFPRITGYVVVGILLSPSLLNVLPREAVDDLGLITEITLAVIAYMIGGSLKIESLRGLEKSITWITLLQSVGAWFLVTGAVAALACMVMPRESFWNTYFPMALIVGAISSATAPAATAAIVHEYKAKGPVTTSLLAVVALDDAIAVIAFAVAVAVSHPLANGTGDLSFYHMLGVPLLHIAGSVGIGAVCALALSGVVRVVKSREVLLVAVFGVILLCAGAANHFGVSVILANMTVGFVVANTVHRGDLFVVVEEVEEVLYAMFFVLAGMHFDLGVLGAAGVLALAVVVVRSVGKYAGTRVAAALSGAPGTVRKYLGLALLPQAGVAIGLALIAAAEFPTFGAVLLNGVMASVIINELITPPVTRYAIVKAGEAQSVAS